MVKFLLRPMRRFVQAKIMKELAALQAEIAALRRETVLRDDFKPMIRQIRIDQADDPADQDRPGR